MGDGGTCHPFGSRSCAFHDLGSNFPDLAWLYGTSGAAFDRSRLFQWRTDGSSANVAHVSLDMVDVLDGDTHVLLPQPQRLRSFCNGAKTRLTNATEAGALLRRLLWTKQLTPRRRSFCLAIFRHSAFLPFTPSVFFSSPNTLSLVSFPFSPILFSMHEEGRGAHELP